MLTTRIIPCLDVKDGQVVKGVKFKNHQVMGDILEFAKRYRDEGADELVFYDITASCDRRQVCTEWVSQVSRLLDIPFCVAGGINSVETARAILAAGADKISVNTPALENPDLINELVEVFGSQCVVVGIDSFYENGDYFVYQYTGDESKIQSTQRRTLDWVREVQARGAGEIVLNCMNQDGVREGYDIKQLSVIREHCKVPLIASGGAGREEDFQTVFKVAHVDGALAASVFHQGIFSVDALKKYLSENDIEVRV